MTAGQAAPESRPDPLDARIGDLVSVRGAFEDMPVIMAEFEGPEHRYVAANRAYREFVKRAECIGRTVSETLPEVAGQQWHTVLDRAYSTGETQVSKEWRLQIGPPDEMREVYVDVTLMPRFGPTGQVTGLLNLTVDVTERVRERKRSQEITAAVEERYRRARDAVHTFQQELLPEGLPVLPDVDLAASYLLADSDIEAGGDWFDAFRVPSGQVALVVGDVVGHGVSAAAAMGQLRAIIRESLERGDSLAGVLAAGDRAARRVRGAMTATACVALLDSETGALAYVTAAHPPPLLVQDDGATARFLPATGSGPLGSDSAVRVRTARLATGDLLLLYTDGLVERPGREFRASTTQFLRVAQDVVTGRALRAPHETLAERTCNQVLELLVRDSGHADDVTLLVAQRRAPVPALHAEFPADATSVRTVRTLLRQWMDRQGLAAYVKANLQHAIAELVSNCVVHAYEPDAVERPCRIDAEIGQDGVLEATVTDFGAWRPAVPAEDRVHGLEMISDLVDSVNVSRSDEGTSVVLSLRPLRPVRMIAGEDFVSRMLPNDTDKEVLLIIEHVLDDGVLLDLDGPIDITTAEALRLDIRRVRLAAPPKIRVDFTSVTHLASAGVAVLYEELVHAAADGVEIELKAPAGTAAQHILSLVALPHRP